MNILDTAANAVRSHITSSAATLKAHATSGTSSTSGTTGSSSSSSGSLSVPSSLTSESTFLNLLVAQIQNQDPLNPTDSIQFVGQLVQFSQLEQLLSINKGVTTLASDVQPPASSTQTPTSGSVNKLN
ncbi:MAG: flagellar hook capping FlgD N-terminal domain-containing protein [Bryobacteraceae bacterium]|jgi:flagellar hook assembly protein FlgD